MADGFKPRSYRVEKARLPVKLLAVRSGLALYGKNNLTYVPRYGSFHRLMAYYTDYDSPKDYWQEKKSLPLCDNCKACLDACPTKAVQKDRFMIQADICLTYLNEKDSKHGFPDWVDISAHNSLVGCMHCQRACPYDKSVLNWYEDRIIFSEKETSYLLKGKYSGVRAEKIEKKLNKIGLDLTLFPRNLIVLLSPHH
ncbi:MAG TPA: 4Fe-4S dicluster domain-containing protein [Euryarchaeota archaeon]|nr:4Fe-4S dicluster domain-containing protein [Euryarchaeota archaeon]